MAESLTRNCCSGQKDTKVAFHYTFHTEIRGLDCRTTNGRGEIKFQQVVRRYNMPKMGVSGD